MTRLALACLVALALAASLVAQTAPGAATLPQTLEQCQAETLDLRAALVDWQERAIRAEAQLARHAIAQARAHLAAKPTAPPPQPERD